MVFRVFSSEEPVGRNGKPARGEEDRQRTAEASARAGGARSRGAPEKGEARRPPTRARWAKRGRCSARVAWAAKEARSGDVALLDPLLFAPNQARASSDAGGGGEDHAPRDAARKDAAGAATLALIVKVAILFQVATERGAAAKNDARRRRARVKSTPFRRRIRQVKTTELQNDGSFAPYNFSGFRVGEWGLIARRESFAFGNSRLGFADRSPPFAPRVRSGDQSNVAFSHPLVHRLLLAEPAPSECRGASRHDTPGSCDTERGSGLDVRGASRLNHRRRGWRRSPPLRRPGRSGWTITPPIGGPARSRRDGTRDSSAASEVAVCARRSPRARDADRIVPRAFAAKPPRPRGRPRPRSARARSARASPPTRGRLP